MKMHKLWRVNTYLDMRLMLWLLAFAVLRALVSPFCGQKFAFAGLTLAAAAIGLALISLLCSVHACSTWLAEILRSRQGEQQARSQSPAAAPRPN